MPVRSGEFVSKFIQSIREEELPEDAVQPNGVDLGIDKLYRVDGTPRITNGDYDKGDRVEVEMEEDERGKYYNLSPSEAYVVVYDEKIEIPEDHIGLVFPRSRIMRSGANVQTAVWDSGYEGRGEGGITVSKELNINKDTRLAQMIFITTESLDQHYQGSHQSERL